MTTDQTGSLTWGGWLKRNAQPILAVGTVAVALATISLGVLGLVTATASAWNALDSKADRTAARVEDKIDAHVDAMDARISRLESKIDEALAEMRTERQIWIEQLNYTNNRLNSTEARVVILENQ